MRTELIIINPEKVKLSRIFLQKVSSLSLLEGVKKRSLSLGKVVFSLVLMSGPEIRRLNKIYRGKNAETDVLSFANYSKRELGLWGGKVIDIGDLVICCSFIRKSARINGQTFEKELAFVVSHGVLHLLGFEHSKIMFDIQDRVANDLAKPVKKKKIYGKSKQ